MIQANSPTTIASPSNGSAVPFRLLALHVFVLCNFAVAQPVYDLLCGRLPFLRDLQIPTAVVYGLVLVLSFGLPGLFVAGLRLAGWRGRSIQRGMASATLFLFFGLLLCAALKQTTFLTAATVYMGSLALAAAGVWLYWKSSRLRLMLTLSAVALPLFPGIFLLRYVASQETRYGLSERTENWKPAPVVLIVFDEFCGQSLMTPDREIDAARFPNLAALAQDGQWFRNAASVHELTMHAVPAILSGRYAQGLWPMALGDRPQNLFSMLVGNGGYEFAAFEPVTRLAPEANSADRSAGDLLTVRLPFFVETLGRVYLSHLTPSEHASCVPEVPKMWFGVRMDQEIDSEAHRGTFRYRWSVNRRSQFEHFLKTIDGAPQPTVHFLHLLMPHVPWSYLPTGERYTEDGAEWELTNLGSESDRWNADELQVVHAQQRYLLQLMYADRLIGDVIAQLKAVGQYDQTLLIVTADHGVSFRPNEYRRSSESGNRDEIVSIPLFIKRPGESRTGANDRPVEAVDIFPTIADVLGYRLTRDVDGWSVFDEQRPPRTTTRIAKESTYNSVPVEKLEKSPAAEEIRKRFGDSRDPAAIYRVGPHPELIGQKVTEFSVGIESKLVLEVTRYGEEWPEDREATVPSFFEGQVRRHNPVDDDPVVLAIAVNGVIQAVTRTYLYAGGLSQWEALVPKAAFHRGRNDVRIYHVTGSAPQWVFSPCAVQPPSETSE